MHAGPIASADGYHSAPMLGMHAGTIALADGYHSASMHGMHARTIALAQGYHNAPILPNVILDEYATKNLL